MLPSLAGQTYDSIVLEECLNQNSPQTSLVFNGHTLQLLSLISHGQFFVLCDHLPKLLVLPLFLLKILVTDFIEQCLYSKKNSSITPMLVS